MLRGWPRTTQTQVKPTSELTCCQSRLIFFQPLCHVASSIVSSQLRQIVGSHYELQKGRRQPQAWPGPPGLMDPEEVPRHPWVFRGHEIPVGSQD